MNHDTWINDYDTHCLSTASRCSHDETSVEIRCYTGPVASGEDENRAAHGSCCDHETCIDCGAVRRVNTNGRHVEAGAWGAADSVPSGMVTTYQDPNGRTLSLTRAQIKELERAGSWPRGQWGYYKTESYAPHRGRSSISNAEFKRLLHGEEITTDAHPWPLVLS